MNPCKEDYEEILSTELQAIKQKLLVVTQWVDKLRRLANSRAVQIDHLLAECQKKDLLIQELKTDVDAINWFSERWVYENQFGVLMSGTYSPIKGMSFIDSIKVDMGKPT